ncbi:hypothetical protein [Roseivirga misakiensis]|uniref:Uncharacterized protein n=1 Tax=Roseivirga misakiensis TaxID=1563681 RepID=A0A1E5T4E0_9BACT|nr:hypothetical protein [Roseivirga misakiensis]OEK06245.1 hypothetical protein BFP71_00795 [Roseivirga misakiensis]
MLNFLRKFRRNYSSKYFSYAIGEIFLVVFGILIALAISDWNDDRKKAKIYNKYYTNMAKEFGSTLDEIESDLLINNEFLLEKLKQSLLLINEKPSGYLDTLNNTIGALGTAWQARVTLPVFREFKDSGLFNDISDDTLKIRLVELEQATNYLKTFDGVIIDQYLNTIEPYIIKHLNYSRTSLPIYSERFIVGGPVDNLEEVANSLELWNILTLKLEAESGKRILLTSVANILEKCIEKINEK